MDRKQSQLYIKQNFSTFTAWWTKEFASLPQAMTCDILKSNKKGFTWKNFSAHTKCFSENRKSLLLEPCTQWKILFCTEPLTARGPIKFYCVTNGNPKQFHLKAKLATCSMLHSVKCVRWFSENLHENDIFNQICLAAASSGLDFCRIFRQLSTDRWNFN